MSTSIDPVPPPTLAPKPVPKPAPPRLRLVSPAPIKRGPLELIDPKQKVQLHPKGCLCAYHKPNTPWGIPKAIKPGSVPLLAGPKVVVWDIENWQGTPLVSPLTLAREFRFTRGVLGLTRDDHIVLGMSHFTANRCTFALPTNSTAIVVGSGPDGADKALIDAINVPRLARHFQSLVVVSNDHIFTTLARQSREAGMTSWNVSSDLSTLSTETRRAYDGWTHLKLTAFRSKAKAFEQARKMRRDAGPPAA